MLGMIRIAQSNTSSGYFQIPGREIHCNGFPFGVATMFVEIPPEERWLWENPAILEEVLRGARQAAASELSPMTFVESQDLPNG